MMTIGAQWEQTKTGFERECVNPHAVYKIHVTPKRRGQPDIAVGVLTEVGVFGLLANCRTLPGAMAFCEAHWRRWAQV